MVSRLCSSFRLRRALLYVPGDDLKKISKASQLNVDCIAFDCEDGVSVNRKSAARETIRNFFNENQCCDPNRQRSEWCVRVNAVSTEYFRDDINVIMSSEQMPQTILLPKCESSDDIKYFANEIATVTNGRCIPPIKLIFFIESCRALISLVDICQTVTQNFKHQLEPTAIVFGSDDYCASIGATRTENSQEILYARQKLVTVAKAFDLQAIDMVHIDFKDLKSLKEQSDDGARMGYTGKQIIHPGQIDIVQNAFLPSNEKLLWATELIEAFDEHQKIGKGAFVYKNQMIDMPTVKQALNILNVHKQAKGDM